jgi:hypothetical protein
LGSIGKTAIDPAGGGIPIAIGTGAVGASRESKGVNIETLIGKNSLENQKSHMKPMLILLSLIITMQSVAQISQRAKDSMELFAPTPKGEPFGQKFTKEIGPGGGKLASPDKTIELHIPEGALSKNTAISIQAAKNNALDGVGHAFELGPSGIQFNVPVKLTLHYQTGQLNGNSPQLLAIVFQDGKGCWLSIEKFKIDTVAKTISGNITHFSSWAISWSFHLRPAKTRVKVSREVFIHTYPQPCAGADPADAGEAVRGIFGENLENPRTWWVNSIVGGDTYNGSVNEGSIFLENGVNYRAPAVVPSANPVEITLQIDGVDMIGEKITMKKTCKIKVYDNHYEVKMITTMRGGGPETWGGKMTYRDEGSFLISVDQDPELLDINNRLEQLNYATCTITPINPTTRTGIIHVKGLKSWKITPANPPTILYATLEIAFIPSIAEFTMFNFNCAPPPGASSYSKGATKPFPMRMSAQPLFIKFKLNDEEQVIQKIGAPGDEIYVRMTVKKKED